MENMVFYIILSTQLNFSRGQIKYSSWLSFPSSKLAEPAAVSQCLKETVFSVITNVNTNPNNHTIWTALLPPF